jgi:hypothetical protein
MDRRGFLRFLGMGVAAAVAAPIIKPKSFFFFGSELWKPPDPYYLTATEIMMRREERMNRIINPPLVCDWINLDQLLDTISRNIGIAPGLVLTDDRIRLRQIT